MRKFLKCCLQESLLLALVMILIIFFCNINTLFTIGEVCICRTVGISFCCIVLHVCCWTVSSASTHTSWRTLCLNNENSFFSLCVLSAEYTICLISHKHSEVWLTQWHRSIVYREILKWWFFNRFFLHLG